VSRAVPHVRELAGVLVGAAVVVLAVVVALVAGAGPSSRSSTALTAVGVIVVVSLLLAATSAVLSRRWHAPVSDVGRGGAVEPVASVDGAVLHTEADGPENAAVTVVLVHDLLLDLTSWQEQRRALEAEGVRVVLYDQRGHGLSGAAPLAGRRSRGAVLADDLAAVIAARAPRGPVVLVGHGVGAMAVQSFAGEHPDLHAERVAGTLLVGTATGPLRDSLGVGASGALARRWYPALLALLARAPGGSSWHFPVQRLAVRRLAGHSGATAELRRQVAAPAGTVAPGTAADFLLAALEHDERSSARLLNRRPVVAVVPGADRFVPVAAQAAMRASVPGVRIVRIAECGHAAPIERPEVVIEHLRVLLAGVTRTPNGGVAGRTLADVELAAGDTEGLLNRTDPGLLRSTRTSTDGLLAAPLPTGPLPDLLQRPKPKA
jgi:pimeloyl-ACP methyl ester carboxylesterase